MKERRVVIVMSRCSGTRASFGIRLERQPDGLWLATWAFAIKDDVARREGFDRTKTAGRFGTDPAYPGCPHCGRKGFFKCGRCERVSCWGGDRAIAVVCPWCKYRGKVEGEIRDLAAGGDA